MAEFGALHEVVEEGESAGLAAERTVSHPGKLDVPLVRILVEGGDDAASAVAKVRADHPGDVFAGLRRVRVVHLAEFHSQVVEPPGEEPLGEFVAGDIREEHLVGHLGQGGEELRQVGGAGVFGVAGPLEDEVPEAEFLADVFGELDEQRLGVFADEAGPEAVRDLLHRALRGLQEDGHVFVVGADDPREADAGVE